MISMASLGVCLFGVCEMKTSVQTSYEAPVLRVHGSLEELTMGSSSGRKLDADFPDGTDFGDLTFS